MAACRRSQERERRKVRSSVCAVDTTNFTFSRWLDSKKVLPMNNYRQFSLFLSGSRFLLLFFFFLCALASSCFYFTPKLLWSRRKSLSLGGLFFTEESGLLSSRLCSTDRRRMTTYYKKWGDILPFQATYELFYRIHTCIIKYVL